MKKAVPPTGAPRCPASIQARAAWCDPPRKVSGAQPTRSPRRSASATKAAASAKSVPSGFSE